MSGDSGYEASEEDLRIMDLYYVARDAGLSHNQAQSSAFQQVAQETTLPTAPTGGGGYEVINIGTQDSPETILVDPNGQFVASVEKTGYNQYGAIGGGGDAGASILTSFNASNLSNQAKDKADNVFGERFGQAIGRPYELLNADGEPYRRFDAKGNLTEFVDRLTGNWAKASDVKPVGTAFDSLAGALVTEFEYGGNKFAPMEGGGGAEYASFMDPYFKDKGGFFGEGGLAKIATLVAAGFAPFALPYLSAGLTAAGATSALGTAGAAGIYGGLTTVGKGLLSGKSFEDSLVDGLKSGAISAVTAGVLSGLSPDVASGLGEEFGDIINIGNSEEGIGSFLDAVKESGGQFTGDMSGAGSDMTFDDLVSATGVQPAGSQIVSDIYSGSDPLDFLDAARQIYGGKGTNEDREIFNKIISNLPPGFNFPGIKPPIDVMRPYQPDAPIGGTPPGGGGGGDGIGGGGGGISPGGSDSSEDTEEEKQKKREQAAGLMAQTQTVLVKPPPVAEIDYMYDIGGESVFATPKQETLMPSPFEEIPEAVEGAMPRYQYYDPQGGYQYAEGGSINNLYEILRGK